MCRHYPHPPIHHQPHPQHLQLHRNVVRGRVGVPVVIHVVEGCRLDRGYVPNTWPKHGRVILKSVIWVTTQKSTVPKRIGMNVNMVVYPDANGTTAKTNVYQDKSLLSIRRSECKK